MPQWILSVLKFLHLITNLSIVTLNCFIYIALFLQIPKGIVKSDSDAAGKLWRLEPWPWNFLVDMQQDIALWCSVGCCHFGTCSSKWGTSGACKASGEVWQSQNCNIKQRVWLSTHRSRSEIVLGTQSHEYGVVKWRGQMKVHAWNDFVNFKKERRMPCFCLENRQLEKLCFWGKAFISRLQCQDCLSIPHDCLGTMPREG